MEAVFCAVVWSRALNCPQMPRVRVQCLRTCSVLHHLLHKNLPVTHQFICKCLQKLGGRCMKPLFQGWRTTGLVFQLVCRAA